MASEEQLSAAESSESRCIMHYSSSNKILLVGDGDFSFSTCLARAFGSAKNMTATSLDTAGEAMGKYRHARENLKMLSELLGCTIVHGVDALSMKCHPALKGHIFDIIIFNFPHAGLRYSTEHDQRQIKLHQAMVSGFFKSARKMLTKGGQIHVTHMTSHPFNMWCVESLANDCGLRLLENPKFYKCDYPGYINKWGAGRVKFDKSFQIGPARTFMFAKASES